MNLVCPSFAPSPPNITFVFNLGIMVVSRETENNACALEAGQTRCIMGDVQMVNITNFAVLLFFCYSMVLNRMSKMLMSI